ncbi:hypothetical protein C8J56DRAFT_931739 [Mycena floridula]|nr:hypothetical protein C8J56DRAFT_931739 [Mycena floridula]
MLVDTEPEEKDMSLPSLPYDLLLNIAAYLDLYDIHALHLTCRALHEFAQTRPVYRHLATALLRRCRALPLKGFQRLMDLSTEQLIRSVSQANRYEQAWRTRAPRPSTSKSLSHYMDDSPDRSWFKVVSSPPGEEVDWLSPITSSYTLCATKSGKVVCWDVQSNTCLAEWNPGANWELWKCRVEFEERMVFFTMAKVQPGGYIEDDGSRVMDFVLMRLDFPEHATIIDPPTFSHVTDFKTAGIVMNIFLLDPSSRLLSAFVWIPSNTIALFVLLDWAQSDYIFVDTGISCTTSSNWSCILFDGNIVIHCEESDEASQHFYPLSLLQMHMRKLPSKDAFPVISGPPVQPLKKLTKKFVFPDLPRPAAPSLPAVAAPPTFAQMAIQGLVLQNGLVIQQNVHPVMPLTVAPTMNPTAPGDNPNNPFPPLLWFPESAHFVRQWWPTLPGIPRVSCTVVLLASHDHISHRTNYVLVQHYFRVPMMELKEKGKGTDGQQALDLDDEDGLNLLWYVNTPFEVVCVAETSGTFDVSDDEPRSRPLVAVDFGHAVWIEYSNEEEVAEGEEESEDKRLRFVTFPPYMDGGKTSRIGDVRTLEIPSELDLDDVETINIDQSQGAVILSVRAGQIFILCYE